MPIPPLFEWALFSNNTKPEVSYYEDSGLIEKEPPPIEYINWSLNEIARKIELFKLSSQYSLLVSDDLFADANDLNYSPSANSGRILLGKSVTIPTGKSVEFQDGMIGVANQTIVINSADNISTVNFRDNVIQQRTLEIIYNHTGTLNNGVLVFGDNNYLNNIVITNAGSGTITNGVNVTGDFNHVNAFVRNTGTGSITNNFVNSGASNILPTVRFI